MTPHSQNEKYSNAISRKTTYLLTYFLVLKKGNNKGDIGIIIGVHPHGSKVGPSQPKKPYPSFHPKPAFIVTFNHPPLSNPLLSMQAPCRKSFPQRKLNGYEYACVNIF
jgi:hypothetical protein